MSELQTVALFALCGLGGLLAAGILRRISLRPIDNLLWGTLAGGGWVLALDANGLGAHVGAGRLDVVGAMGQLAAGAIGATVCLSVIRLVRDLAGPEETPPAA